MFKGYGQGSGSRVMFKGHGQGSYSKIKFCGFPNPQSKLRSHIQNLEFDYDLSVKVIVKVISRKLLGKISNLQCLTFFCRKGILDEFFTNFLPYF